MQPAQLPYSPNEPRPDESHGTRKLVGLVLLAIGAIVALVVVQRVFQVLSEGSDFPLIERLIAERGAIGTPTGEVILPESFFVLAAYGIVIALLAIAAGLARAFLGTGAQLLHLDARTLLRRLREEHWPDPGSPSSTSGGRF
jgi:hypothetical protein